MVNQLQQGKKSKKNNKRQRGKQSALQPSANPAPHAAPRPSLSFFSTSAWDLAKLDTAAGIEEIYFGAEFSIKE